LGMQVRPEKVAPPAYGATGAVYELSVVHAALPLGWRARCTILELESSNEQRTNRAEEL
jgi:hypothetical protein